MKYLDEQIEIQVDFGSGGTTQKGMYNFYVYEYDPDSRSEDEEIIYVGNYYYQGNRYQTFNITDIVRTRRTYDKTNQLINTTNYLNDEGWIKKQYRIKAFRKTSNATSSWTQVSMIWRYPNVNNPYTSGDAVFVWGSGASGLVRPCLQGYNNSTLQLTPHYPKKYTSKYKYAQTFVHSVDNQGFHLWTSNEDFEDFCHFGPGHDPLSTNVYVRLDSIMDWQRHEQEIDTGGDVYIWVSNDDDDSWIPCGVMDTCYKRYYLQWMDRYGGYQSQAFNDISDFSIDYKVTETQSYIGERNKSFIAAQPKWKISSGWIDENVYPYYESIFVSPSVILYDSQEDVTYNVFVKGNFTEKKFKKEKKLLNLSLELELKTKQNIIY